jgi:crossover junction endodeoxyribonuclease RuvC
MTTKILGIDPAARCGWAHSDGHHGVWDLVNKTDRHPGTRLERLRSNLYGIKRLLGVDLVAFEDAAFGSINANTAAMHNELRGVIKLIASEWSVPVELYKPSQIKKWLTGNGNAKKDQMIRFVESMFGVRTSDDNVADGIAIMEMAKANLKLKEPTKWQSQKNVPF